MADPHICTDCKGNIKIHAKGLCIRCYGKKSMRRFRKLNPEKDKARKRKWYLAHKSEVCFIRKKIDRIRRETSTVD